MAIQCDDTEPLVQTYLDGELAEEDAAVLQAHLAACTPCNQAATEVARFHARLREKLAPPTAPTHLRGRIFDALDREDISMRRQRASRWNWTLPAAASLAAAAALLFFFVSTNKQPAESPVAYDAVRQHQRRAPIEAAGAAAGSWVREHLSSDMHVPRFSSTSTSLRGVRLSHLRGHDAAQVFYETRVGHRLYDVSALILRPRKLKLCSGRSYEIGGRVFCVSRNRGFFVVTHKDEEGIGYVFISQMDPDTFLDFLGTSDLIWRSSESHHRMRR